MSQPITKRNPGDSNGKDIDKDKSGVGGLLLKRKSKDATAAPAAEGKNSADTPSPSSSSADRRSGDSSSERERADQAAMAVMKGFGVCLPAMSNPLSPPAAAPASRSPSPSGSGPGSASPVAQLGASTSLATTAGAGGATPSPKQHDLSAVDDPSKQYKLLEKVGSGSFGVVYRATHISSGMVVAIKQIDLEDSDDDITEIQMEIAHLSACDSEWVTRYYGSFVRGYKLWIGASRCRSAVQGSSDGKLTNTPVRPQSWSTWLEDRVWIWLVVARLHMSLTVADQNVAPARTAQAWTFLGNAHCHHLSRAAART